VIPLSPALSRQTPCDSLVACLLDNRMVFALV